MKSKLLWFLSVLFLFSLFYCGGSQKMLSEGEERRLTKEKIPSWVDNPKEKNTKDKRAVVGISKNYAQLSSARSDAILQAQKEAVTLMSSNLVRQIKESLASQGITTEIVDEATAKNDLTTLQAEGYFEGEVDEFFIEKYEKMVGGTKRYYYRAYVCLLYPRDLAKKSAQKLLAMRKQKEEDANKKKLIEQAEKLVDTMEFDW